MAIVWGALTGSPWRFRIGIEVLSVGAVTASTTSVPVQFRLWFNTPNTIAYNNTSTSWSTAFGSGTMAANLNGSNYSQVIGTTTVNVTPINPGWGKLEIKIDASLGGLSGFTSGTATVSYTHPIGWATPNPPTNATVTRVDDWTQRLTWTNNPTNAAPYKGIRVVRWDQWKLDEGYKVVATLSGAPTSWTDYSTGPNSRYQYGVYAFNDTTSDGAAWTSYVSTTPSAPTNVTAAKTAAGDILVTWTNTARMASYVEVWDRPDGGAGVFLGSLYTFDGANSYTHTGPSNTATHAYFVKHYTYDQNPRLWSADSATSNTVQLLAAPGKPTQLGPQVMDPADLTPITWRHNPTDTTGQTAYELQHRPAGGAWTSTGKIASTGQAWTTPGTWPAGTNYEVQVRTWGQHADPSPWSDVHVVALSGRPSATILTPAATLNSSSVAASWAYYDPESTAQSAAEVELLDQAGTVLETVNIDGPGTEAQLQTRVDDQAAHTLRVRVRDGSGLWSVDAVQPFTVAYLPPASPTVAAQWDTSTGAAVLTFGYTDPLDDPTLAGRSLLPDPGFNTSAGPLPIRGDLYGRFWQHDTSVGRTSPGSLRWDAEAAGVGWAWTYSDAQAATTGHQYVLTFWTRNPTGAVRFTVHQSGPAGLVGNIGTTVVPASGVDEWQRAQVAFTTLSADVTSMQVNVEADESVAGSTWIDDLTLVDVTATGPVAEYVAAETVELWRGGTLAATVPAPAGPADVVALVDPIPPTTGVEYQVVTWSDLPSSATRTVTLDPDPDVAGRFWLNAGPGWSVVASASFGIARSRTVERARTLSHYSGRQLPVETIGDAVTDEVRLRARVWTLAEADAWAEVHQAGTTVCYRDPHGLRLFGSAGPAPQDSQQTAGPFDLSATITRTDYQEE